MSTPKNSMSISLTGDEKLNTAVSLFVRDHVTEAYPLFQELAKAGNPRALYFLGEYYRKGWAGLPVDENLGFQYHHEGAEKGEVLCQLNLAYEEENIQEDIVQAVIPKVFPLAQAGDVVAQHELGDALTNLEHLNDVSLCHLDVAKEAEYWLEKAAKAGYWRAMDDLANSYWGERNIEKNLNKAVQWNKVLAQMQGDHVSDAVESLGLLYEALGDYDKKFQQSAKWAAEGYGWPMYYVAECYQDGKGVTENQDKAIEWYQKAYECHGEVAGPAAFVLGCMYGNQGNMEKAFAWYSKGAAEGLDWCMCSLANCYRDGEGVSQDLEKAMEWYQKTYDCHGTVAGDAANQIGRLYYLDGNYEEAFGWQCKGVEEGCMDAMFNLAGLYRDGEGVGKDYDKAIEWYEKVYRLHGEMAGLAANMIGMIYCDEQDDAEKAFDWALKGAEEGFDAAMSNLGGMYRRGHGVKKNLDKAIEWYQKAYELHGDDAGFAAYQLAGIYSDEENVVKKWEWTEKSAQEGYDEAMLDIGLRYDGDDELSEDLDQAMEWYQKAYAQHGSVAGDAAILIAMIYERKDQEEKAFEWYSKGAEEGSEDAMYFLAQSYEYGAGVQANREKAIEWYQKVVDCHGDEEEEAEEHLQALLKEIEEG